MISYQTSQPASRRECAQPEKSYYRQYSNRCISESNTICSTIIYRRAHHLPSAARPSSHRHRCWGAAACSGEPWPPPPSSLPPWPPRQRRRPSQRWHGAAPPRPPKFRRVPQPSHQLWALLLPCPAEAEAPRPRPLAEAQGEMATPPCRTGLTGHEVRRRAAAQERERGADWGNRRRQEMVRVAPTLWVPAEAARRRKPPAELASARAQWAPRARARSVVAETLSRGAEHAEGVLGAALSGWAAP